jgi:hypothetical protein
MMKTIGTPIEYILETEKYINMVEDGSRWINVNGHDIFGYCRYAKFYELMVSIAKGPCVFVEVGSFLGQSTAILSYLIDKYKKPIVIDCVDIFDLSDFSDGEHKRYINQLKGAFFETFLENMKKSKTIHNIRYIHKGTSVEIAKKYPEHSIDLVYLDASHLKEHLLWDLKSWTPKVKKDGVIAGDDLDHKGVYEALEEFFEKDEKGIKNSRSTNFGTWAVVKE